MNNLLVQAAMPPPPTIPYGFCQCGCGRKTQIAKVTDGRRGHVKGHYMNYLHAHNSRLPRKLPQQPNPSGLCFCGCGNKTPLAVKTSRRRGVVQGCHARFCVGHGYKLPPSEPINKTGSCMCGCGRPVNVVHESGHGRRKGEFYRFAQGHNSWVNPRGHVAEHYVIQQLNYPTPCWIWNRTLDDDGYGRHCVDAIPTSAHRYYYALFKGPIPKGFHIDHLCVNRACVNPSHLEAVRPEVNEQRKRARIRERIRLREIRKAQCGSEALFAL